MGWDHYQLRVIEVNSNLREYQAVIGLQGEGKVVCGPGFKVDGLPPTVVYVMMTPLFTFQRNFLRRGTFCGANSIANGGNFLKLSLGYVTGVGNCVVCV